MTSKLRRAIELAKAAHQGQKRKISDVPYIIHPLRIALSLPEYIEWFSEELQIAAVLHDVVEDTMINIESIEEEFGPKVADYVGQLTDDETEMAKVGKQSYQLNKMMEMVDGVLLVKLLDRLDNVSENPSSKYKVMTVNTLTDLMIKRDLPNEHYSIVAKIFRAIK